MKNKSRIASFYDIKSLQAGIANDRLHAILELIGPHQDKSILDIGCGKGHLLKHLTGQYKVGVDISIEALNVAKNYCDKTCVLNIDEDGLSIFPDESFDIIIMTELLEHLFFPEFALKEAHRVLKMGGFLIVSVPNSAMFTNRLRILIGKFEFPNEDEHIRFFDFKKIKKLVYNCGFRIIDFRYVPTSILTKKLCYIRPQLFACQFIFKLVKNR